VYFTTEVKCLGDWLLTDASRSTLAVKHALAVLALVDLTYELMQGNRV
jgi:hypothetical protein